MEQRIIISKHLEEELAVAISECEHDRVFVLVDSTTKAQCWPVVSGFFSLRNAHVIEIAPTDMHKNINQVITVWQALADHGATRHLVALLPLPSNVASTLSTFPPHCWPWSTPR